MYILYNYKVIKLYIYIYKIIILFKGKKWTCQMRTFLDFIIPLIYLINYISFTYVKETKIQCILQSLYIQPLSSQELHSTITFQRSKQYSLCNLKFSLLFLVNKQLVSKPFDFSNQKQLKSFAHHIF